MRVLCPSHQVILYYRGKYDSCHEAGDRHPGLSNFDQSCFLISHAAFHVQTNV